MPLTWNGVPKVARFHPTQGSITASAIAAETMRNAAAPAGAARRRSTAHNATASDATARNGRLSVRASPASPSSSPGTRAPRADQRPRVTTPTIASSQPATSTTASDDSMPRIVVSRETGPSSHSAAPQRAAAPSPARSSSRARITPAATSSSAHNESARWTNSHGEALPAVASAASGTSSAIHSGW